MANRWGNNRKSDKLYFVGLQNHCFSHELPDVQVGFRKDRGTRDQIANICWIIGKAREFQRSIYLCFIDYAKAFDCVDHNKLWKILRDENTRPPYLSPEKPVCGSRSNSYNWCGMTDSFKIGKGVCQGCILSPCLFNLYAEDIMRNAGLDEAQAGIKIVRRNINNLIIQVTPPLWQKVKRN